MTDKKICVYAICKNESKWIERWLDNMSPADYIVVLDTGSTDGSYEMLKNDPRVTRVEQKVITPWRFDDARNESMKLAPEDTEIFVCTDFDEFFEDGWCDVLRENWQDNYTRCYYRYAWSHNDLGEPTNVFRYDKIHTKDYYWKFPVHEVLFPNENIEIEDILDTEDRIYLHHMQDATKERNYFDLIKLCVEENPEESHCRLLLAREYHLMGDYEKALEEYIKCLSYENIHNENRHLVLIEVYNKIAELSFTLDKYEQAMLMYTRFIDVDKDHREPYFGLGELYNHLGMYALGYAVTRVGFETTTRKYDWVEYKDNWISRGNDIIAVSCYYLGKYGEALDNIKIAVEHDPNNTRLIKNMNSILLANYESTINNDVIGS